MKIYSIIKSFVYKKNNNTSEIVNLNQCNCCEDNDIENTYYECIPFYSENDYINAIEDNSDEALYDLRRKVLNGCASVFENKWLVWRSNNGDIKKTSQYINFYGEFDFNDAIKKIEEVQKKAIRAENMHKTTFCKFSYDMKDQDLFATHVTLEREYIQDEVYVDCGKHAGVHFLEIENINLCMDHRYTFYGNKIVLLKPVRGEIYYEYLENTFVGNKVYVEKVLYMDDVETWRYLNMVSPSIRCKKNEIIEYLKSLEDEKDYSASIEYMRTVLI